MRTFIISFFLASSIFLVKEAWSQQLISFDSLVEQNAPKFAKHRLTTYFNECTNEFQVIVTGFFVGYKSFFSSQDGKNCTFTPSCSVYAIQSVRNKGVILGFMDAVDRLTRCNGLSPVSYNTDTESKLLIDYP